jgi:hypothetical protein
VSRPDSIGRYLNVQSVETVNTFTVNTLGKGHQPDVADRFFWVKAEDVQPKFNTQIKLRDVAYTIDGLNINITGLDNHNFVVGNFLVLSYNGNIKFERILSTTSTTVTVNKNTIVEGNILDISFAFGQGDIAETSFEFLTTNNYKTFL